MTKLQAASVDADEVKKFSRIAEEWWNPHGKFRPLHKLNPVRINYIRQKCNLEGATVLDIGCGGGLLCEPLTRLGAKVTGIDASEKNIKTASLHAKKSELDIEYICTTAEDMAQSGRKFDVVLNMEVIEHVADVASFMQASCNLLKNDGVMILATLNRTVKSFAFAIVGAEYILKWLPRGTHNWQKFLKPSEINSHFAENGMQLQEIKGVTLNPLKNQWQISEDIAVNYMLCAVKM